MNIWIVVRWNVEAWKINSKKISYCTVQCVHMGCHCACCCGFKSNLFLLYTTFSTLFQSINIGFDELSVPKIQQFISPCALLERNLRNWKFSECLLLGWSDGCISLIFQRYMTFTYGTVPLLLLLFNFKVVSLWFKMLLHTRRVPTINLHTVVSDERTFCRTLNAFLYIFNIFVKSTVLSNENGWWLVMSIVNVLPMPVIFDPLHSA